MIAAPPRTCQRGGGTTPNRALSATKATPARLRASSKRGSARPITSDRPRGLVVKRAHGRVPRSTNGIVGSSRRSTEMKVSTVSTVIVWFAVFALSVGAVPMRAEAICEACGGESQGECSCQASCGIVGQQQIEDCQTCCVNQRWATVKKAPPGQMRDGGWEKAKKISDACKNDCGRCGTYS